MIPQVLKISKRKSPWQAALINSVTDPHELLAILQLDDPNNPKFAPTPFPLRVPRGFIAKMKTGNMNDPLLMQVLPLSKESVLTEGFSHDPLQELSQNPRSGLLHKFKNRVLLTVTGSCAVHCRYCFRRYFPYDKNNPSLKNWDAQLDYIRERPEIVEIILSGGDPLMATDAYLTQLIQKLETIPHVKYLRIHTRIPIVLPERIDASCLQWLSNTRFKTTVVLHCNHPNELCENIAKAVHALRNINITVLNQSVLLKGVNDNLETLTQLSFALYDHGILPYYVHLLDPVQGSQHFEVDAQTISDLIRDLPAELPGFLLPRFVREVPGMKHKMQINA